MKIRIYNNELNPSIWIGDKIKPEVRETLLLTANEFHKDSEITAPIQDIYLLGSGANYNWTATSDIDLHILIDFKKINPDVELVKTTMDLLKSNWNNKHNVCIKSHKIEIYIQDITEKNRSTGVFSVLNNVWVKVPRKLNINVDKESIQKKYSNIIVNIQKSIDSGDINKLKAVSKSIYDMREAGLSTEGEFSTENIVFKILRARKYIEKLKKAINDLYDEKLSIK